MRDIKKPFGIKDQMWTLDCSPPKARQPGRVDQANAGQDSIIRKKMSRRASRGSRQNSCGGSACTAEAPSTSSMAERTFLACPDDQGSDCHCRQVLATDGKAVKMPGQGGRAALPCFGRRQPHWAEGCRNAALFWREIARLGLAGRHGTLQGWAGSGAGPTRRAPQAMPAANPADRRPPRRQARGRRHQEPPARECQPVTQTGSGRKRSHRRRILPERCGRPVRRRRSPGEQRRTCLAERSSKTKKRTEKTKERTENVRFRSLEQVLSYEVLL